DGTGMLSAPLGFTFSLSMLTFDNLTLGSSPLSDLVVVGLDGSGMLTSPLGFHVSQLFALRQTADLASTLGTGMLTAPLGFRGQPIFMDRGTSSVSLLGTATGDAIAPSAASYPAADQLVGTGSVSVGLSAAPGTTAPVSTRPAVPIAP
ncbi:MAG: hypothetical protein AAF602_01570, partial [Myxococcota bacterium]